MQPHNVTFETGRKLCRHLAATNRSHLDVNARLEILEAYRPVAERILQDLEAMYVAAPLPLAPGPRAALGLTREFLTELALGYRIAIVDFRGTLFSAKKQLAALLLRATQYTAARLFAAYKSYTPVPDATWAELHELYLRAEERGVARDPGPDKESLADVYCSSSSSTTTAMHAWSRHRALLKSPTASSSSP